MIESSETLLQHDIQQLLQRRRIPNATYRLQFNHLFTFAQAQELVPYLRDLGISHAYASPIFQARAGSMHGYDIANHAQINSELGGEEPFASFADALQSAGMGIILDTVPNHMGIGELNNNWWIDVLENGPSSSYADYFDIDWQPVKAELKDKVLLPFLGDQYGLVLERGELRLVYRDGAFYVTYYDTQLPVAPRSYRFILRQRLDDLVATLGEEHPDVLEYQSILTAIGYLPQLGVRDSQQIAERNREKEIIKRRIATLYNQSTEVRQSIDQALVDFNGTVGDPHSFDLLDHLLSKQPYRLAFWRVAAEEINYRRFFDVNDLTAVRVEHPQVFEETHRLIFRLLAENKAQGLRIDHPDGLWDPKRYFQRLQSGYLAHTLKLMLSTVPEDSRPSAAEIDTAIDALLEEIRNTPGEPWPLYVVAEKILSEREPLPEDWEVAGTTGYDFLNDVNGLFVDSANRRTFDQIYSRFIGQTIRFDDLVNQSKTTIMELSLASEVNALGHLLDRISETSRAYRDFTLNGITAAIREVITALGVYRTYIDAPNGTISPRDEQEIEAAIKEAKRRNPAVDESIYNFLRDTLLLGNTAEFTPEERDAIQQFVMKFQQVTGPMTAKGVEDTAFYVYNRLASLNEVGGHPTQFGLSPSSFHRRNSARLRRWSHAMLASSTHDTKRSEDVRARINVLSELPGEWRTALTRWSRLNARKKTVIDGERAPDRNDEYLLYQTLLGIWPPAEDHAAREALTDRVVAYMLKATREAKTHTSWVQPNAGYEAALESFIRQILDERHSRQFLNDFQRLQQLVAFFGQFNALSQTLLKLTAPGMPDIYQGNEIWDFSLVDPDNRRPVDYQLRRWLLTEMQAEVARREGGRGTTQHKATALTRYARSLFEHPLDNRLKLYVTWRALQFRAAHPALFAQGSYAPLEVIGSEREHCCAFTREYGDDAVLVAVPRLLARLTNGSPQLPFGKRVWGEAWMPLPREWIGVPIRNLYTGEQLQPAEFEGVPGLALAELFAAFPVALLQRG